MVVASSGARKNATGCCCAMPPPSPSGTTPRPRATSTSDTPTVATRRPVRAPGSAEGEAHRHNSHRDHKSSVPIRTCLVPPRLMPVPERVSLAAEGAPSTDAGPPCRDLGGALAAESGIWGSTPAACPSLTRRSSARTPAAPETPIDGATSSGRQLGPDGRPLRGPAPAPGVVAFGLLTGVRRRAGGLLGDGHPDHGPAQADDHYGDFEETLVDGFEDAGDDGGERHHGDSESER